MSKILKSLIDPAPRTIRIPLTPRTALERHVVGCHKCAGMIQSALCGEGTIMLGRYIDALRKVKV